MKEQISPVFKRSWSQEVKLEPFLGVEVVTVISLEDLEERTEEIGTSIPQ